MTRIHARPGTVLFGLMGGLLLIAAWALSLDPRDGAPSLCFVFSSLLLAVWRFTSAHVVLLRNQILVVQPWRTVPIPRLRYQGVQGENGTVVVEKSRGEVGVFAFSPSLIASFLGDRRRARFLADLDRWGRGVGVSDLEARITAPLLRSLPGQAVIVLGSGQLIAWFAVRSS